MWKRLGRQPLTAALVVGAMGLLAAGSPVWAQNAPPTNQSQGENKTAPQRPTATGSQTTPPRPTTTGNQTTPKQVADEEAKKQAENAQAAGANAQQNAGANAQNAAGNAQSAAGDAANALSGDERLLKMLAEEEAKYRLRLAKIQRIETIAKEKGDEALLARVGKVMAKLEAQHERKMAGMRQRFGERNVNAGIDRLNKARGGRGKSNANRGRGNAASGSDKVFVCHVSEEDGTRRTIEISRAALQAHLDHGDTLGPCEGDEAVNDKSATDPGRGSNAGNRPDKPQRGAGGENRPVNQPDKNAGGGQGKGRGPNSGGGNNQGGG